MKIILIIPPSPDNRKIIRWIDCSHESKASYLWQPNDFIIITSLLKPKDEVSFIDGTADFLSKKKFFEEVKKTTGDILIFALSTVCWQSDFYFFQEVKKVFSNTPVFVLGDIVLEPYYQSLILKECNGIVFNPYQLNLERMLYVKDNPDATLPGIYQKLGQEIYSKSKMATFIESNIPRHETFIKPGYSFPFAKHFKFAQITTVWGCPFSCSYCPESSIPPLVRNFGDVLKELEYVSDLGIKELSFSDKCFGFPEQNSIPLLKEMSKKFNFSWSCYFHPQLYNPYLIELMHSAGCHTIIIGIETENSASLRQYKRTVRKENIDALLAQANQLNMNICADFILGLENETETDILNTIEYALKLPIDFASFNILAPFPGSGIRKKAISSGSCIVDIEGFDSLGHDGNIGNKYVSSDRLRQIRAEAIRRFYLRLSYLLRRLRKISSWEHFCIQFNNMLSLIKKL